MFHHTWNEWLVIMNEISNYESCIKSTNRKRHILKSEGIKGMKNYTDWWLTTTNAKIYGVILEKTKEYIGIKDKNTIWLKTWRMIILNTIKKNNISTVARYGNV